jgi:hypothetical protein
MEVGQVRRQRKTYEEDIDLAGFVTRNGFNCSDVGCVAEKPDIPRVISASKVEADRTSPETFVVTIVQYYILYRNLLFQTCAWDFWGGFGDVVPACPTATNFLDSVLSSSAWIFQG